MKRTKARCTNLAGQCLERKQVEIDLRQMRGVCEADHLINRGWLPYDHHVIVKEVNREKEIIEFYEFSKQNLDFKVRKRIESFSDLKGTWYKAIYGENEALKPDEVLTRARNISNFFEHFEDVIKRTDNILNKAEKKGFIVPPAAKKALEQGDFLKSLDELVKSVFRDSYTSHGKKFGSLMDEIDEIKENYEPYGNYGFLMNNCEHFAHYCKLNYKRSVQVANFGRTIGGLAANASKDVFLAFLLSEAKVMAGTLKIGGVLTSGIIEAALSADDIYRFYKMWDGGKIDEGEFVVLILKRALVAVSAVSGGAVGASVGLCIFGPLGLVIGGLIGNVIGRFAGRFAGEAVEYCGEKIDEYCRLGSGTVKKLLDMQSNSKHLHLE